MPDRETILGRVYALPAVDHAITEKEIRENPNLIWSGTVCMGDSTEERAYFIVSRTSYPDIPHHTIDLTIGGIMEEKEKTIREFIDALGDPIRHEKDAKDSSIHHLNWLFICREQDLNLN